MIAAGPSILVAHPSVKAANLKEFIELARAKPGSLNFGSSGIGSTPHLAVELLRQMTKTDMVHVPYSNVRSN
jgi:tripartite-type tricarboxylate transporter receptor subunit TctC